MKPFDVKRVPLEGRNLIEAAAGTGKTYSIEQLFVRLVMEKRLPVESILTVTFTKAATAELRERIHARLLDARNSSTRSPEGFAAPDMPPRMVSRLASRALGDFDRAAIFTIHGFCQRLLHEYAFETGNSFDTEMLPDQTPIIRQIAEDFWRLKLSRVPEELIAYSLDRLGGPARLLAFLSTVKDSRFRIIPRIEETQFTHLDSYRQALARLRSEWPVLHLEALALLKDRALNATVYGALKPAGLEGSFTQREIRLGAMQEAMEVFLSQESTVFPPFAGLLKFTSAYLAQKTQQRRSPPQHPLFDLCQTLFSEARALEDEMSAYVRHFKADLIGYARSELRRRQRNRNVQSFEDLLLAVNAALSAEHGHALAEAVRSRYRAVLVDEFQDTDDLQYSIFAKLFDDDQNCLFWIGDPKQSIYGFRGADVFAYLKAARRAQSSYTLVENRRSIPELVQAVNTIFSGCAEPFLFPDIAFIPAHVAGDSAASGLGELTIWYLDSRRFREDGRPLARAEAEPLIAKAVSAEIQRLMQADGPAIPAGDMAVLVRTNAQGRMIKDHLASAGIPSVVCSTGSIFDSHEAMELQRILLSIAEPADAIRLKAALATDMLGAKADELAGHDPDSTWWEAHFTRCRSYFESWQRDGFMAMFRSLMAREGVKARLLRYIDGERRLTNLLHLAELLHQASEDGSLGMIGLIRWLALQRDPSSPRLEEHQLRLESDDQAVKIVTVHKSKGLEYRVVFCPYAWSGSTIDREDVLFHDPADGFGLTLDLSADKASRSRACAENELLSENLRLLYVALTRAKERCYLVWGRINTAETSSMAYLFHHADMPPPADRAAEFSMPSHLRKAMKLKGDDDLIGELKRIAGRSGGSIQVRSLPETARVTPRGRSMAAPDVLSCRRFRGDIDRSWRTASYSMLVAASSHTLEGPDRDMDFLTSRNESGLGDRGGTTTVRRDMFTFPAGSRAGIFFHEILEAVDFSLGRHPGNEAIIEQKLGEFGFDADWRSTVAGMIEAVGSVPIAGLEHGFTLQQVAAEDRIHEMEFYHALKPLSPGLLREVFERFAPRKAIQGFPERLERLAFRPSRGFMKGYIDMIVCHEGRFFLLDWKSNYLGDGYEHYHVSRLSDAMRNEFYILQYHLYTLALHLYLRQRVAGYDYQKHFGGVAYIFIRGVARSCGCDSGIYTDRPALTLIHALGQALVPDYE